MQTNEQTDILLKRIPEITPRFFCPSCQRDRNVKDRIFKLKKVGLRIQKVVRCKFCGTV